MPIDQVLLRLRTGWPSAAAWGVCALALGLGSAAQAQDVDCDAAMTQRDINACMAQDYAAADAELNDAYAAARTAMRETDEALSADLRGAEVALRDGQRAWITFRDNACAAEGFQMRGGSGEPMLVYGCMARLTKQRAQDLWDLAAGFDG